MSRNRGGETPLDPPFDDYLVLSLVAVFCCLPFGIPAIIFTFKTKKANRQGEEQKAKKYSNVALILGLIGTILGIWIYTANLTACLSR